MTKITINDGRTAGRDFRFAFGGHWVYNEGYGDRFYGGDEHWTSAKVFGDETPSFTLYFRGHAVSLYGHRVPEGACAEVTVDGQFMGVLDYYTPHRQEKDLLYSALLDAEGEHVLTVKLLPESNPAAGKTREASIDYAVVTCDDDAFPAEEIVPDRRALYLEPGLCCRIGCTILPDYATNVPPLRFRSSDPEVIAVGEDGTVCGIREGEARVTAYLEGTELSAEVDVTCGADSGLLCGTVSDDGRHTDPDAYFDTLRQAALDPVRTWRGTAFRDDRAMVKADLFAKGVPLPNVRASVTDFRTADGSVIPASAAEVRFVTPTFAHDVKKYVPDCLDRRGPVDYDAMTVHTLFALVSVPAEAAAGEYTAELKVEADGVPALTFSLKLEVLPYTLPEQAPFQLELWTYPYSCERYYSGKTTEEYFGGGISRLPYCHLTGEADDALLSQLRLYAKAGGRAITATCVEDPWNTQTPDPYPSMIKWHWREDGGFYFDYTDYDKWVKMNMACGIDGQIKTFSITAWGNRVTYIDEDAGVVRTENLVPASDRWKEVWGAFLRDYMRHTLETGWFDITYMSMDERGPEDIRALLDLNDSVKTPDGRSFKVSLAVFRFDAEALFDRIDDLSLALYMDREKVKRIAAHRRECEKLTRLYTCGASCSALSNPPHESEWSMLYTQALGTDGFLRWALDAFNADPIASSAHRLFAAGDLYLIYPDHPGEGREAHTSHRFEKIAAGIRDAEKLRVLRREKPECAAELDALLDSFGRDGGRDDDLRRFHEKFNELARR